MVTSGRGVRLGLVSKPVWVGSKTIEEKGKRQTKKERGTHEAPNEQRFDGLEVIRQLIGSVALLHYITRNMNRDSAICV